MQNLLMRLRLSPTQPPCVGFGHSVTFGVAVAELHDFQRLGRPQGFPDAKALRRRPTCIFSSFHPFSPM